MAGTAASTTFGCGIPQPLIVPRTAAPSSNLVESFDIRSRACAGPSRPPSLHQARSPMVSGAMDPNDCARRVYRLPFISVIVPCYNQAHFLYEALNSVVGQTFTNWEMIVVDDASTDRCKADADEYRRTFASNRIRTYTKPNGGLSSARNYGIERAIGEWICALDADDYLHPDYLRSVAAVIARDPSLTMIYSNQQFFYESDWKWHTPDFSRKGTLYSGQFPVNTVYRKADWETVGGYTEVLPWGNEDWNMWISLSGIRPDVRVHKIPDFLLYYRYKSKSMQRDMTRYPEVVPMLRTMHPNDYPLEELVDYHKTIITQMSLATYEDLEKRLQKLPGNSLLHLWIGMYWEGLGVEDQADGHYAAAAASAPAATRWQPLYRRAMVQRGTLGKALCLNVTGTIPWIRRLKREFRCTA
ncbi:nucleotide-diphospho-sugar transferase [Hyaloraphidium curvatum]|nr:nucleotide-diphospho-sugar transferase [Hyaloraphidium curvatum]